MLAFEARACNAADVTERDQTTVQLLVNIDVPDLDGAVRFYTTGLGFVLRRMLFGHSVAELELDASRIYLIERSPGTEAIPGQPILRTYERHWTPVHLDLVVDDLESASKRAIAAGAARSGQPTSHTWGRLAPLTDPYGHGFCLLEFSGLGYGAVAD